MFFISAILYHSPWYLRGQEFLFAVHLSSEELKLRLLVFTKIARKRICDLQTN